MSRPQARRSHGQQTHSMEKPSPKEMRVLKSRFARMDEDGNYYLSYAEMCSFLRSGNPDMTERELRGLYHGIDRDKDGQVAFDEFVEYIFRKKELPAADPKAVLGRSPLRGRPGPGASHPSLSTSPLAANGDPSPLRGWDASRSSPTSSRSLQPSLLGQHLAQRPLLGSHY
mmetsp:Transcript_85175/g.198039  ORF Transcript_85175/g.198039 Transcript_85175/m.198039 type:complete len:171 (-) Transcript_85175:226-738(-)